MTKPNIMSFQWEDADGNEQTYYVVNPAYEPEEKQTYDHPGSPGWPYWTKVTVAADGSGPDLTDKVVAGTWTQGLFVKTADFVTRACTE